MALKAGTLDDFANSMAEAMEKALDAIWRKKLNQGLPASTQDDRRMLFVAIAQGVVKHLSERARPAFKISVKVTQKEPWIVSKGGTTGTSGTGGSHSHSVTVNQETNNTNRIKSEGEGKVTLATEGILY